MEERRSFPRTGLTLPVQLTVVSSMSGDNQFAGNLTGVTFDISRGGCAILTDMEVAVRSRCIARFPEAVGRVDPDTVWANVRRTERRDGGVLLGLEFETPLETLRIAPDTTGRRRRDSEPRTVLVVDDQPGIRGLISRYLGERGFTVQTAADGEEAFFMLTRQQPDIMLLDLYLPRLNGHDLLRRMREVQIEVDLIFTMSGHADTIDAQECLRLGATDHLLKPLDLELLHRSIMIRLGAHSA
jgi:CheY-like chemotaxis protein